MRFISFALIVLTPWALRAQSAPRRALVIGNGAYLGVCRTETPRRNGEAIANVLENIGFKTTTGFDLDEEAMRGKINTFFASLEAGDMVFIYFSGFAIRAEDRNWLLPVSYQKAQVLEIHAYGLKRLLEQLEEKRVLAAVIVLDANRACPAWPDTEDGLAPVSPRQRGLLIAFSAEAHQGTAFDPRDGGVNLFTTELLRSLSTIGLRPVDVFMKTKDAVAANKSSEIPWFDYFGPLDFYLTGAPAPIPPVEPRIVEVKPKLHPGEVVANMQDEENYAWIPAGSFQMGCVPQDKQCAEDEKPLHPVSISRGFWITTTEVTVEAYERFADATGRKKPPPTKTNAKGMISNMPETKVLWQDAEDFCGWAGPDGRLPSEAEWEYAARGGVDGAIYPWGDQFNPERANSYEKSRRKGKYLETTPAKHYEPNKLNLFDLIGNVREWTLYAYDPQAYVGEGPFIDPVSKQGVKDERVVRGGSFNEKGKDLRISARDHRPADKGDNQTGFRCVLPNIP